MIFRSSVRHVQSHALSFFWKCQSFPVRSGLSLGKTLIRNIISSSQAACFPFSSLPRRHHPRPPKEWNKHCWKNWQEWSADFPWVKLEQTGLGCEECAKARVRPSSWSKFRACRAATWFRSCQLSFTCSGVSTSFVFHRLST